MLLGSLPCLCLDLHAYVFFVMFIVRSTCFEALGHVYAQIYMPMCSLPCLCLDLHVCAQIYIPMFRSMCLCAPCHACVLRSMLVAIPCASKALHLLISLFLMFCLLWQGVDLDPVVQAYIHIPRPILKGLDHFLCMSMFACLLLCFFSILASLDLGLAMLCAPRGFACMVTSFPPRVHLDVTTCEIHLRGVGALDSHFSSLRPMLICLPCLLCPTHLDFFASLHLCTPAYMFMHKSVCRPYSNPMELWTLDPNLHLSSQDTPFCLITCCLPLHVLHMFVCPCLAYFASLSFSMLSFYLFIYLSASLLRVHTWSKDA